jgi:hypothetical protein
VHRGEDSEMGVANTASAGEPGATFTYFVHLFTFNISHWNLHITATPPPSNRPQPPPTQMSQPPFRAWSRGIACGAIGGGRDGTENHSITPPPENPNAERNVASVVLGRTKYILCIRYSPHRPRYVSLGVTSRPATTTRQLDHLAHPSHPPRR